MAITHLLIGFAIATGGTVASIDYIERAYAVGADSAAAVQSLLVSEQVDAAAKAYEAFNLSKPASVQELVDSGYLDGKKVTANAAAFQDVGSREVSLAKVAQVNEQLGALIEEGRQMIGSEPVLDGAYVQEGDLLYLVRATSAEECQAALVKYQEAQIEATCTPVGEAVSLRVLVGPAV